MWITKYPFSETAEGLAPEPINKETQDSCPAAVPRCRGVDCAISIASISAPYVKLANKYK